MQKEFDPMMWLYAQYNEPHRKYHTWEHIAHMLMRAGEIHQLTGDNVSVLTKPQFWAILYHDAAYEVHQPAGANERGSAHIACKHLSQPWVMAGHGLSFEDLKTIEQIILDTTAPHTATILASELVIDLDLMGFEAPWDTYCQIQRKVRLELAPGTFTAMGDNVKSQESRKWCEGRKTFLESYMKRDPFFYHDGCFDTRTALENMGRECEMLQKGEML